MPSPIAQAREVKFSADECISTAFAGNHWAVPEGARRAGLGKVPPYAQQTVKFVVGKVVEIGERDISPTCCSLRILTDSTLPWRLTIGRRAGLLRDAIIASPANGTKAGAQSR